MNGAKAKTLLDNLNREQLRIVANGWLILAAYVTVNSAAYIYLDLFRSDDNGTFALTNLVMWGAGYAMLVGMMQRAGYYRSGKRSGVGTYFVLGILVLLCVLLGLVFLILPGLYLLLRWLPVYADALVNGGGATAAMQRSWKMTDGVLFPLALAAIGPAIIFAIAIGIPLVGTFHPTLLSTGWIAAYNVAFALGIAWFTTLGIASFGILSANLPATDDSLADTASA